jgi:hypothetical protein
MKQTVQERREIAKNPSTPIDTLKQLAADKDKLVRVCVAINLSTPVDILKQLATDKDVGVRVCAGSVAYFRVAMAAQGL